MHLTLEPNFILFEAPAEELARIHAKFSYRDKSVEYQLNKFIKRMMYWTAKGFWRSKFDSEDEFKKWKEDKEKELRSKLDVFCCDINLLPQRKMTVPIGLYSALCEDLKERHLIFDIKDNRNFDLPRKNLTGFCPKLRPYQMEAIREALKVPVGMLEMATGTGKTRCFIEIIKNYGVRSLFLVPSRSILDQTVKSLVASVGSSNVGIYGGGKKKHKWITVATYQSVYAAGADEFNEYDLVCSDEAGHLPSDTYYEVVENRLKNAVYRIGGTADRHRLDGGTILVEAATGPIVYSYDAPQAIKEGYLARPTFVIYEITKTEGSYIKWITDKEDNRVQDGIIQSEAYTGDEVLPAFKSWILGNDLLTKAVCDLVIEFQKEKNVLILIDELEHIDKLMGYLKPYSAEAVTGQTDNNEDAIARFNARKLKIIIGSSAIGEGTDLISTDVLFNLQGGTTCKQQNGRALRNDPDPDTGVPRKPTALIIDFDVPICPVLHRHSLLREQVHSSCGPVYRRELI